MGRTFHPKWPKARDQYLSLAILVSLVVLGVATYVAVTIDLFGWEVDITRWLQGYSLGPARFLREWLFWMGIRGVAGAVFAIAVGALWLKRQRLEAIFLVMVGGPDLFNALLREIIGRPRPTHDLVEVIGGPQGYSFPSGTTLHVLLFSGFLLFLLDGHIKSRRVAYTLWAFAALYALVSGVWVIYDGRHWFTDVMGGYVYGAFYLLVLIAAYKWTRAWLQAGGALRLPDKLPRVFRAPARYVVRLIV